MKPEEKLAIVHALIQKVHAGETRWHKRDPLQSYTIGEFDLRLTDGSVRISAYHAEYGRTGHRFCLCDIDGNQLDGCDLSSNEMWPGSWGDQPEEEIALDNALCNLYELAKSSYNDANDPVKKMLKEMQTETAIGK